jgi:hypothetical protein
VKLLFLDVDGVLNAHEFHPDIMCGQIHRDKVELLNGILLSTGARIVLSSAWRYIVYRGEMNLMGMEWLLRSHGVLANRLVGITRRDTTVDRPPDWKGDLQTWVKNDERGEQISDWLETCIGMTGFNCSGYVVIDDMDLGISAAGHPFVQTDGSVGMRAEHAKKAVEILMGVSK